MPSEPANSPPPSTRPPLSRAATASTGGTLSRVNTTSSRFWNSEYTADDLTRDLKQIQSSLNRDLDYLQSMREQARSSGKDTSLITTALVDGEALSVTMDQYISKSKRSPRWWSSLKKSMHLGRSDKSEADDDSANVSQGIYKPEVLLNQLRRVQGAMRAVSRPVD